MAKSSTDHSSEIDAAGKEPWHERRRQRQVPALQIRLDLRPLHVTAPAHAAFLRGVEHEVQRPIDVKVLGAERIEVRDQRHHAVAGHLRGRGVGQRPARERPTLLGVVDQRLGHVAGLPRKHHALQRRHPAIGVPVGVVGVLRVPGRNGVNVAVEPDVAAVDIVESVGVQQRMVERGVEREDVVFGVAGNPDARQRIIPLRWMRRRATSSKFTAASSRFLRAPSMST